MTVIDIASRRVLGWATAGHLRIELVANGLRITCIDSTAASATAVPAETRPPSQPDHHTKVSVKAEQSQARCEGVPMPLSGLR